MAKPAGAHVIEAADRAGWRVPTTVAITRARVRLGVLHRCGCCSPGSPARPAPDTPGFNLYRDKRVVTVDGFTPDLRDDAGECRACAGGGNESDSFNPYPQLRALLLADREPAVAGRHARARGAGEKTLALDLPPALGAGMLVLAGPELPLLGPVDHGGCDPADLCGRSLTRSTDADHPAC